MHPGGVGLNDDYISLAVKQYVTNEVFLATLQGMWQAGADRASPGALGMNFKDDHGNQLVGCHLGPVERRDLEHLVDRCRVAEWVQDAVGNDWIIQTPG